MEGESHLGKRKLRQLFPPLACCRSLGKSEYWLTLGVGKITSETFEIFYSGDIEQERGVAVALDQEMGKKFSKDIGHRQMVFYF